MLPAVGHSKQLSNKSQERVPVTVYASPLSPDCDTPYLRLAAVLEFCCKKPMILTVAAGCTINTHSPLAILCSSLLLCWLSGSGQGLEVCWSGSVLGFGGCPASYRLIPSERNPRKSCPVHLHLARSLWAFNAWSIQQYWLHLPLSRTGLYLFQTGWHGAKNVLQLDIKLCNIWESPWWNEGKFKPFGRRGAETFWMLNF